MFLVFLYMLLCYHFRFHFPCKFLPVSLSRLRVFIKHGVSQWAKMKIHHGAIPFLPTLHQLSQQESCSIVQLCLCLFPTQVLSDNFKSAETFSTLVVYLGFTPFIYRGIFMSPQQAKVYGRAYHKCLTICVVPDSPTYSVVHKIERKSIGKCRCCLEEDCKQFVWV